jgi:hypothetical protein
MNKIPALTMTTKATDPTTIPAIAPAVSPLFVEGKGDGIGPGIMYDTAWTFVFAWTSESDWFVADATEDWKGARTEFVTAELLVSVAMKA